MSTPKNNIDSEILALQERLLREYVYPKSKNYCPLSEEENSKEDEQLIADLDFDEDDSVVNPDNPWEVAAYVKLQRYEKMGKKMVTADVPTYNKEPYVKKELEPLQIDLMHYTDPKTLDFFVEMTSYLFLYYQQYPSKCCIPRFRDKSYNDYYRYYQKNGFLNIDYLLDEYSNIDELHRKTLAIVEELFANYSNNGDLLGLSYLDFLKLHLLKSNAFQEAINEYLELGIDPYLKARYIDFIIDGMVSQFIYESYGLSLSKDVIMENPPFYDYILDEYYECIGLKKLEDKGKEI